MANNDKVGLVSRNITVLGKRTSVRLEIQMWDALHDIAGREQCSIHDICSLVARMKQKKLSLTASIRIFLMMYYKAAATDEGHEKAGHGNFVKMLDRAKNIATGSTKVIYRNQAMETLVEVGLNARQPYYG
jgi:predicted DNA-binding ribbon-helix-helix protein